MEQEIQSQVKVAGFESAMLGYHQLRQQAEGNLLGKRKEEFLNYVQRVCFKNDDPIIPDLYTQEQVVARYKDL